MILKIVFDVFSLDAITHFINFHNVTEEKHTKYPFMIVNTERSDKKETQWWSILDVSPKKEIFLYDSFGFIVIIIIIVYFIIIASFIVSLHSLH